MRVLFAAVLCLLPVSAVADPVELTGRFLIERDAIAALPGAPDPSDAVPGGILDGTWVVDLKALSREALMSGDHAGVVPFASAFTVSVLGRALFGEVFSHSRVTGQDAPAGGATGDRIVVEAFAEGIAHGAWDSLRLILTGPADWFETTAPGAVPDLGRATITFEGESLRGEALVQERAGTALGPLKLRRIGPAMMIDADRESDMLNVEAPSTDQGGRLFETVPAANFDRLI
jgi:hypothetical protein